MSRFYKEVAVEDGQSIHDLAIMYYGNLEGLSLLMADNSFENPNVVLGSGDVVLVRNNPTPSSTNQSGTIDSLDVLADYARNRVAVNTGDLWQTGGEYSFDFSFDFS